MSINLKLRDHKSRIAFDDKQNRLQSIKIKKNIIPYQDSIVLLSKRTNRKKSLFTYAYVALFIQKLRLRAEKSMYRKMLLEQWLKTQTSYKNDILIICETIKYPIINNDQIKIVGKEKLFLQFQQLAKLSQKMENMLKKQLNKLNAPFIKELKLQKSLQLGQSFQIDNISDFCNDPQINCNSLLVGYYLSGLAIDFSIYSEYFKHLRDHQKIIACVEKKYPMFLKECQKSLRAKLQDINPHKINMEIKDTIQQPLFRILKYVLLIKKYIKLLPDGHPDSQNMHNSLEKFQIINQFNNSLIKKIQKEEKKSALFEKISIEKSLQSLDEQLQDVSYVCQFECKSLQGETKVYIFTRFVIFAVGKSNSKQSYQIMKLDHLSNLVCKVNKKYYRNIVLVHGQQFSKTLFFQTKESSQKFSVYLQKILKDIKIDLLNRNNVVKTRSFFNSQIQKKNRKGMKGYQSQGQDYGGQQNNYNLSVQVGRAQVRQLGVFSDQIVFQVKVSMNQFDQSKFTIEDHFSINLSALNNSSLLNNKIGNYQEKIKKSQIMSENISFLCKANKADLIKDQSSLLHQIFPKAEEKPLNQLLFLTWEQIQALHRTTSQRMQQIIMHLGLNDFLLSQNQPYFQGKTRLIQTKCIVIQQFLNPIFRSSFLLMHFKEALQQIGISSRFISNFIKVNNANYKQLHQQKCQQCKQVNKIYDFQQLEQFEQKYKRRVIDKYKIPLTAINCTKENFYLSCNLENNKYDLSNVVESRMIPTKLSSLFFSAEQPSVQQIKSTTKTSKIQLVYNKKSYKSPSKKQQCDKGSCFEAYKIFRKLVLQTDLREVDTFNRQISFYQYWNGQLKFDSLNSNSQKQIKTFSVQIYVHTVQIEKIVVFLNYNTYVSQLLSQIEYVLNFQSLESFGLFIKLEKEQRLLDQHQKAYSAFNQSNVSIQDSTQLINNINENPLQSYDKNRSQINISSFDYKSFAQNNQVNNYSFNKSPSQVSWTVSSLSKIISKIKKDKAIICLRKYIFHPKQFQIRNYQNYHNYQNQRSLRNSNQKNAFKREQSIMIQFFNSKKCTNEQLNQKLKLIVLFWLYIQQIGILTKNIQRNQNKKEQIALLINSKSFKYLQKILFPSKDIVYCQKLQKELLEMAQKQKILRQVCRSSQLKIKRQLYEKSLRLIWEHEDFTSYRMSGSFHSIMIKKIQSNSELQNIRYSANAQQIKKQNKVLEQRYIKNSALSFLKGQQLQLRVNFKSIIIVRNNQRIMECPLNLVKVIDTPYSLYIQFSDVANGYVNSLKFDGRLFHKISKLVELYQFLLWKFQ